MRYQQCQIISFCKLIVYVQHIIFLKYHTFWPEKLYYIILKIRINIMVLAVELNLSAD